MSKSFLALYILADLVALAFPLMKNGAYSGHLLKAAFSFLFIGVLFNVTWPRVMAIRTREGEAMLPKDSFAYMGLSFACVMWFIVVGLCIGV